MKKNYDTDEELSFPPHLTTTLIASYQVISDQELELFSPHIPTEALANTLNLDEEALQIRLLLLDK